MRPSSLLRTMALGVFTWLCIQQAAGVAEPIRIALIGPLSGPFANIGTNFWRSLEAEVDRCYR